MINKNTLIKLFKAKGYELRYDPYYANIFGIRKYNGRVNRFDDVIGILKKRKDNEDFDLYTYQATTDPGITYMKKLLNPKGTAILVEGQYKNAYKLGMHQGKIKALVQAKPVSVYRDDNLNNKHDPKSKIFTGMFGINIHRASKNKILDLIGSWSAGCQVIQKYSDYKEFLDLCKTSEIQHGNRFNYTLFNEIDYINMIQANPMGLEKIKR